MVPRRSWCAAVPCFLTTGAEPRVDKERSLNNLIGNREVLGNEALPGFLGFGCTARDRSKLTPPISKIEALEGEEWTSAFSISRARRVHVALRELCYR